ncbi:glycosyltransferase family 4 protein [Dasania marina]|uniref:glycosyltransferase family 4 protein n=1 Tax=Dasania marina TaxID=471499 RepID=UPI0030DAC228|tara:strand:- start:26249 stop:27463 length:1215 start_codon:yes stop_codon:yes gene_type:complete
MSRVLITAYDVNPYSGSESATGWNYSYYLSRTHKVTLVTRNNNIPEVMRYVNENKLDVNSLEVVGFDLPYWACFWKRGARGSFLYFYLWQFFLSIKFFSRKDDFDICHCLNFHCDWVPSFLWFLGKPFVWGPINHNEKLPGYLFEGESIKNKLKNTVGNYVKLLFWRFDPFLFLCRLKADKILVGHDDVVRRLKLDFSKCNMFNQISTDVHPVCSKKNKLFNVLFVGRGLVIKNYCSVLEAVERSLGLSENCLDLTVTFVGVGSAAKSELLYKAAQLGIENRLIVHEWVAFSDMGKFYRDASVLCFPSFEGAGLVLAESLSYGTPVITIDKNGASHELDPSCSYVVKSSSKNEIAEGISAALCELINDREKLLRMSLAAAKYAEANLSWPVKAERISNIYSGLK